MKNTIHPQWFTDATVTCACGNTFNTGSTVETISVDICNKCHPFFTGEMRFVDRQGRVDRFMEKMKAAEARKAAQAEKSQAKTKADTIPAGPQKSYKDILGEQQKRLKTVKAEAKVA